MYENYREIQDTRSKLMRPIFWSYVILTISFVLIVMIETPDPDGPQRMNWCCKYAFLYYGFEFFMANKNKTEVMLDVSSFLHCQYFVKLRAVFIVFQNSLK